MAPKILSILVPTCNRADTAARTVAMLAAQQPDVELLVQDCSDDERLGAMLRERGVTGVDYHYAGRGLSMADNWSQGLERATGEYVTILGDDDALFPGAAAAARWLQAQGLEGLNTKGGGALRYRWPNGEVPGHAIIYDATGASAPLDAQGEFLRQCRAHGGSVESLVGPYYGLVRRELLTGLRARTGVWVDGLQPDHYLALAVSSQTKRAVRVDFPLFLAGSCAARQPKKRKKRDDARTKEHVARYADLYWPEHLPREPLTYRASTAQTLDVVLGHIGRDDLKPELSLSEVYSDYLLSAPRHAVRELRHFRHAARQLQQPVPTAYAGLLRATTEQLLELLRGRLKLRARLGLPMPGIAREVDGVDDMTQAVALTVEHLRRAHVKAPWADA